MSPAVHDQYTAALGAGSVGPGDVNFGAGTAWVLLANTDRLARPIVNKAFTCSHPVPGIFGQMLSMSNGGSAIQWVMKLLGHEQAGLHEIDDLLETASVGSDGLRFWPLLLAGAEAEEPFRSGGRLERITLAHRGGHVVRAVVEGLACELARHLRFLTNAGLTTSRLSMCGSAATSRTTPQIIADVTNLPVTCVNVSEVSALGAAMVACALVERKKPLGQLARQWAPTSRTVSPGPHAFAYRELLDQYLAPFGSDCCGAAPAGPGRRS